MGSNESQALSMCLRHDELPLESAGPPRVLLGTPAAGAPRVVETCQGCRTARGSPRWVVRAEPGLTWLWERTTVLELLQELTSTFRHSFI